MKSEDYDRYYVLLKDGYTVLNFTMRISSSYIPGYKDMEFIGGQNKSLIVICKELFLFTEPIKSMIHSYARVPLLARISPSVISALSKASANHSSITLTVTSLSGSDRKLNLTFANSQDTEENSKMFPICIILAPAIITQSLKAMKSHGSSQKVQSAKTMVKNSLIQPLQPLSSLLSETDISSISLTPKFEFHYLRLFKYCILFLGQLNDYARQTMADGEYSSNEASKFYRQHNLNGRNVVVGVGDSGIDLKSTYFYDPDNPVKKAASGSGNHRKVKLYIPLFGSDETYTDGHGTHVCGSIAGKAYDTDGSQYNVILYKLFQNRESQKRPNYYF